MITRQWFFSFFEIPIRFSPRKMQNERQRVTTMDEKFARLRTYRNNVDRYRRLLKTELSEIERQFIERRLNEEKSAMESLAISAHTQVEKTPSEHFMKSVHDELALLNAKRLSFKKQNAISARHDFVFRLASIILRCPHPRQTVVQARSDPQGIYNLR